MLTAHGLSDPGPVRRNNEDTFASDDQLRLFIVADGMGGHSAGEVASRLAVDVVVGFVRRSQEDADLSWPYGIAPDLSYEGNCLRTAIHLANRRVFRAAERDDEYTGMGTTVVAALIGDHRLSIGHAGDSRAYLLANGRLDQLTADDTWAATVLADHPEGAHIDGPLPMRHVLTNVIGVREQAEVHLSEYELRGGEVILLCSDGVHNVLDDRALLEIVSRDAPAADLAQQLIQTSLDRGARDNVTAVVIHYDGNR